MDETLESVPGDLVCDRDCNRWLDRGAEPKDIPVGIVVCVQQGLRVVAVLWTNNINGTFVRWIFDNTIRLLDHEDT